MKFLFCYSLPFVPYAFSLSQLLTGQAYIIVWRNPLIKIYLSCQRACLYVCSFLLCFLSFPNSIFNSIHTIFFNFRLQTISVSVVSPLYNRQLVLPITVHFCTIHYKFPYIVLCLSKTYGYHSRNLNERKE